LTAPLPAIVAIGRPPQPYRRTDRWLMLKPEGKPARHYPVYAADDGGEIVAGWLVQEHLEARP